MTNAMKPIISYMSKVFLTLWQQPLRGGRFGGEGGLARKPNRERKKEKEKKKETKTKRKRKMRVPPERKRERERETTVEL